MTITIWWPDTPPPPPPPDPAPFRNGSQGCAILPLIALVAVIAFVVMDALHHRPPGPPPLRPSHHDGQ
jgi:hypothetical protein